MKRLDNELFGVITAKAEVNSRRRMHYDLRTEAFEPRLEDGSPSWHDTSMKMLNVLMRDSVIPVHRHADTNEVVIVMRGSGMEVTFCNVNEHENEGYVESSEVLSVLESYGVPEGLRVTDCVRIEAGSDCSGVVVGRGVWHTFIALEDGTTIFEAKDGAYDAAKTEEIYTLK